MLTSSDRESCSLHLGLTFNKEAEVTTDIPVAKVGIERNKDLLDDLEDQPSHGVWFSFV